MDQAKYLIMISEPGLSLREQEALTERLKCAVVLALPERVRAEQVVVQPKVNDALKA